MLCMSDVMEKKKRARLMSKKRDDLVQQVIDGTGRLYFDDARRQGFCEASRFMATSMRDFIGYSIAKSASDGNAPPCEIIMAFFHKMTADLDRLSEDIEHQVRVDKATQQ